MFPGPAPYNVLYLKLSTCLQQVPVASLQIAQDDLSQTEAIYQSVRENATQAYVKCNA